MAGMSTEVVIRKRTVARKRSQVGYGVGVLVVAVFIAFWFASVEVPLAVRWIFGIAFGYVLQRSRFCFTASLRDPVLTGSTSLTRAVIIGLAVSTVGFAAIQLGPFLAGKPVPGHISPIGFHVAIGATFFGIGMVIAGGCASGTLMRMGEGFAQQWIAIIFFVAGSVLGAYHFGWWDKVFISNSPKIHLPAVLGWPVAFFGQLLVLAALYVLAIWWENRKLTK